MPKSLTELQARNAELEAELEVAERQAVESAEAEQAELEARLAQYRNQHGVPTPPSNQVEMIANEAERKFLRTQAMLRDRESRARIDPDDAKWHHTMAFTEMLRQYGNDREWGTPNIREMLKNVEPRDLGNPRHFLSRPRTQ